MRHASRLAAAAALALGACLSLPRPEPVDLYTIAPHLGGSPVTGSGPPVLVSAPRAGPGLDGPRMAYVKRPNELRYYARSQWVEPPARMLGPLLVRALERTGRFQAVTEVALGSAAGLRLDSQVVRLQQEFTVRPSRVRFALRLELTDVAAHRIIGTREIEAVETAPSDDAPGGVAAANAAVKRALADAAGWCAELGERPAAPGGSPAPR
ncbi:MAG TPA: ABC-type transport auxiliary lipoprotein family protein [Anaeromyxobacteraceae bacterium]|nr:ABC-type transport auxiliary lipoprotein family protein [Anaeromyxobacteraceae bacterium]